MASRKTVTKVCSMCGKLFEFSGFGHLYCSECKIVDDAAFEKVKNYIYKHGPATALEVEENTGISEKRIIQYLKEGRLEIPENSPIYIRCEKCGRDIRSGTYCPECAGQMCKDLNSMLTFDSNAVGDAPKYKPQNGKMHFLTKESR